MEFPVPDLEVCAERNSRGRGRPGHFIYHVIRAETFLRVNMDVYYPGIQLNIAACALSVPRLLAVT